MAVLYDFERSRKRSGEVGQNLFLVGTAEKGPYMEPILINSPEEAARTFGSIGRGNIVRAFNEAFDEQRDCPIYCMRIGATASELTIYDDFTMDEPILYFQSSDVVDDTQCAVVFKLTEFVDEAGKSDIRKVLFLQTKNGHFSYILDDDMTVNHVSKMVNKDYRAGVHEIKCSAIDPKHMVSYLYRNFEDVVLPFTPGNDGTEMNKDYIFLELEIAYNILQGRNVDVIVPVDCYIDDIHPAFLYARDSYYGKAVYSRTADYLTLVDKENNDQPVTFHKQLIDFCYKQTHLGHVTSGVIGFRPLVSIPKDIEVDNTFLERILDMTAFRTRVGLIEEINGKFYDRGLFLHAVASELIFNYGETPYHTSGAVRYAAILASTTETTTNMKVGDDVELRYQLPDTTRSDLSRLGIVSFRNSVRKGLVVQSGVTSAHESTPYHSVANLRMLQVTLVALNQAIDYVRSQDYVGAMLRSYTERMIAETMMMLKSTGVVERYGMTINWVDDNSNGEILLSLKSRNRIESINVVSELNRSVM